VTHAVGAPAQRASQAPTLRVAWVSSQDILRQTPGYAVAESTFAREFRSSESEIQKLQQQLDSAVQAFEQGSIALSPTARQTKQRELQGLQQRFQQRGQELQLRAQQRERELLEPITQRVTSVIQGIRAEGNYAFIFDVPNPSIIAADPSLNLTSRVLERLRQAP
jgi:outer membrane protein